MLENLEWPGEKQKKKPIQNSLCRSGSVGNYWRD